MPPIYFGFYFAGEVKFFVSDGRAPKTVIFLQVVLCSLQKHGPQILYKITEHVGEYLSQLGKHGRDRFEFLLLDVLQYGQITERRGQAWSEL